MDLNNDLKFILFILFNSIPKVREVLRSDQNLYMRFLTELYVSGPPESKNKFSSNNLSVPRFLFLGLG